MSFRLKTILGIVLIQAVFFSLLLWLGLGFFGKTSENEFNQRADAILRAYTVTSKDALITSDLAALKALTNEMMKYPGVVYARVRDVDGKALAEAGAPAQLGRKPIQHRGLSTLQGDILDISAAVAEAGATFGKVEVGLSVAELKQDQILAEKYGAAFVALGMALVAMFAWGLGAFLTRQLKELSAGAADLAKGNFGLLIPVRGKDELGNAASAFNDMSVQLRQTYTELSASEQEKRRVLENVTDGIFTLDSSGAITDASPGAGRIFERAESSLRGAALASLFSESATVSRGLTDASEQPNQNLLLSPADGRIKAQWLELNLTTIKGGNASQSMLAVVRDVTMRVNSDQELHLRGRVIEAMGLGYVLADANQQDFPILDVNPTFEKITGYSLAEVQGKNCRFLQGGGTDKAELQRLREALHKGVDFNSLLLNYRKDGKPFWNELNIMPIRNGNGAVTHFVALQSDVTARVNAQRTLARREAHLSGVLNATHDGIVVMDQAGTIENFNVGAGRMFGRIPEEMIGVNIGDTVVLQKSKELAAFVYQYLNAAQGQPVSDEREFEISTRDGNSLWLAIRMGEIKLEDQRRFIGVIHNVTERKRWEMELIAAKKAAEDAGNAKSDFLANMSHEIRTPMHGVLGSIEMLRETALTSQQQRHLNTAGTSASLLLSVIEEILDFSRLEAGKMRIESLEYDLRMGVEDVTAMLAQRAHSKRIELACYIQPDVPQIVRGDPIRLRQILTNLVGNAIKFTEAGEVVVTVTYLADAASGPTLRFEVRDTGIGIPLDKQAQLFQPFTQADNSTSRRFGGSGLGLSIARRLVELMDGTIGLTSQEGKGSTFWFNLPALVPATALRDTRDVEFAGTRVLVVDDNSTNRIILHRYLTAWGAQSNSAASGDEALAKLQDAAIAGRPYHVALLDLNMPQMDGYELIEHIQSDPALAAMPLIMLSSSVQDETRMKGKRVDIWLDKPVRQSDLHDALATVLNGQEMAPSVMPDSRLGTPSRFAGEQILLVEDNAVTREVGSEMLRNRGFTVEVANDGAEAVLAVQKKDFDLILMDVQMPVMDGYTATREIRQWEASTGKPRKPILALTAHAMPSDRAKCLDAGMDDYVVKPYSSHGLATVIARWLNPPGQRPQQPKASPVLDTARLGEVRQIMGSKFVELLTKAATSLQAHTGDLLAAEQLHDDKTGREVAHRLKNTAGDIGATRMHQLASKLERSYVDGIAGNPDKGRLALIEQLLPACTEAVAALKQISA